MKVKLSGLMNPCLPPRSYPQAAQHGADGKCRQLGIGRVVAQRFTGDFIFARASQARPIGSLPGGSPASSSTPGREWPEIGEDDRWVRSYSNPNRVWKAPSRLPNGTMPKKSMRGIEAIPFGPPESDPQFNSTTRMISPKPSGDDGEVIAAQTQGRRAQQNAENRGEQPRERQALRHPEIDRQ